MRMDIVERLKILARGNHLDLADIVCNDAITEIEELREEVKRLNFVLDAYVERQR